MAAVATKSGPAWWVVLLEGIAAIILGLLLLTAPAITVETIVIFLGAFWLVDGIFSIVRIFLKDSDTHWGWLLARGILGILAGIYILRHRLISGIMVPTIFVLVMGIQGIIIGVIALIEAFRGGGWGPGIMGALSIIFGLILTFNSFLGALALPWVFGIFGLIGGVVLIIQAFRLK
jgi:uncharacterized membrane protein HdeD (DUF308 family)